MSYYKQILNLQVQFKPKLEEINVVAYSVVFQFHSHNLTVIKMTIKLIRVSSSTCVTITTRATDKKNEIFISKVIERQSLFSSCA